MAPQPIPDTRNVDRGTRAILAASVDNLLEWYDFSVYALFAVYIGENFFPAGRAGASGLVLGVPPLFLWLDNARTEHALVLASAGLGVLASSFTGVAPMVLAARFPTRLRATGVSITYNAAVTIFGGFVPALLTWFTGTAAGSVFAPAWYIEAAALPAIVALARPQRQ